MLWQDWLLTVLLLLAGVLALSSLWARRVPQAEQTLKRLTLAQGILGVLVLVWGAYRLIAFITSGLGFFAIVYFFSLLLAIALGLLLGYKLIRKPASAAGATEAGDKVQATLSKNQIALGLGGLAAAVLLFVLAVGGPSVPTPVYVPTPTPVPTPGPTPEPMRIPQPTPAPTPQ